MVILNRRDQCLVYKNMSVNVCLCPWGVRVNSYLHGLTLRACMVFTVDGKTCRCVPKVDGANLLLLYVIELDKCIINLVVGELSLYFSVWADTETI